MSLIAGSGCEGTAQSGVCTMSYNLWLWTLSALGPYSPLSYVKTETSVSDLTCSFSEREGVVLS